MSPRRSKTICFPSGLTSREIHVPSSVSNSMFEVGPCAAETSHFGSVFFDESRAAVVSAGGVAPSRKQTLSIVATETRRMFRSEEIMGITEVTSLKCEEEDTCLVARMQATKMGPSLHLF